MIFASAVSSLLPFLPVPAACMARTWLHLADCAVAGYVAPSRFRKHRLLELATRYAVVGGAGLTSDFQRQERKSCCTRPAGASTRPAPWR